MAQFILGTTKHCYIQNIEALVLVFSEKNFFFSFSHCKSNETIDPRGVEGHGWQYCCRGPLAIATNHISKLCA